jgi:phosphoribosyl 1,2-cyclic phosphate phosphodiesterase
MNELLFLGTGGSHGIPMIGCQCAVCQSQNPKNQRMRPSALLTVQGQKILIDAGPDLRFQALRFGIDGIDGVIITHTHFDHIGGLDELRSFYLLQKRKVPVLLSQNSYNDLYRRLPYLFQEKTAGVSLSAQLEFHLLKEKRGEVNFAGIEGRYMTYEQGGMEVNGWRFGSLAYISDIRNYPETLFADLQGVKILIVSALRPKPSLMHFSFDEGLAFAKKVGAESTYFMHISHEVEHEKMNNTLPSGVHLAYDGLKLNW